MAAFLEEVGFFGRSILENPFVVSLARCAWLLLTATGVPVPGLSLALLCSASWDMCQEGKSCPFTSEMTPDAAEQLPQEIGQVPRKEGSLFIKFSLRQKLPVGWQRSAR